MFSDLHKTSVAAEGVESIGSGFVTKYFDAMTGKPESSALRQFYNETSSYVLAHGRPDYEIYGLYVVGWFVKRMECNKFMVTVRSVDTTIRVHSTEFTVMSVCELMRPDNNVPWKFIQTFVIKRVPWTQADEFQIVETHTKFDDEIVEDFHPKPASTPTTPTQADCMNTLPETLEGSGHIHGYLRITPDEEETAVNIDTPKDLWSNCKTCGNNLAAVNSSARMNLLAKRDESIMRKAEMLVTAGEDCEESRAKQMVIGDSEVEYTDYPIDGLVAVKQKEHKAYQDTSALDDTTAEACNGPIEVSRKSCKINDKCSDGVAPRDFNDGVVVDIVKPIELENDGGGVPSSYIRRLGRIWGRTFIQEVVYPLCLNIMLNPLEW